VRLAAPFFPPSPAKCICGWIWHRISHPSATLITMLSGMEIEDLRECRRTKAHAATERGQSALGAIATRDQAAKCAIRRRSLAKDVARSSAGWWARLGPLRRIV